MCCSKLSKLRLAIIIGLTQSTLLRRDIHKRNHQVGIMDKIYPGAKHVFACVGTHTDDSEYLMKLNKKRRSILEAIHKWSRPEASSCWSTTCGQIPYGMICKHTWIRFRRLLTMYISERLRVCKDFVSFMRRPYFARVWILQELYLATGVSYCCRSTVRICENSRALDVLLLFWIERDMALLTGTREESRALNSRGSIPRTTPPEQTWRQLYEDALNLHSPRTCLLLSSSFQKQLLGEISKTMSRF